MDGSRSSDVWDAERLNLALAAAKLGDWSWDAKTDLVTFSTRAAEILDIAANARITQTVMLDWLHPDDRERTGRAVEQAIAHQEAYSTEYRLVNGGRERWVCTSGRGRYDERGQLLGTFGVIQDITSDRLLVRVDDAVRSLVKPEDITYTAARVLGQHLRVHRCAYAFVEDDEDTFILTGNYTNGVQSIVGRYRFRQFGAECLRLMRKGLPYVVYDSEADSRIDEEDRKSYALTAIRSVICVPILKSGHFVAAMAVHMNVPRTWSAGDVELVQQVASRCWESIERARVEHEREALLEAAEAANRVKDEFLAMLGHELRNPLAPILTALQLMQLRDDQPFERERTVIARQVNHLTRLVDDLLDVSRIARGKIELKCEIVEMADILARAIEMVSPMLEQQAHRLEVNDPPKGVVVEGDAERLTQVVSNLLTNAAKYTPPGGTITISTSADAEMVTLRVRDTGIGMTPEVLRHAFDLFVQGRQSIDRGQGGLGLGLTIVRSLVERHGGTVSAHSTGLNQGSEFVVGLPRARDRVGDVGVPIRQQDSSNGPGVKPIRILVVDDNEDAAEMLATALSLHGCDVEVAHDGPEALRIAAAHDFDAGLLDIGLPVMDGYELAARLRELPTIAGAHLIAITGYGQNTDRERALAAGFQAHLVKPVDLEALQGIVRRLPSAADAAKNLNKRLRDTD